MSASAAASVSSMLALTPPCLPVQTSVLSTGPTVFLGSMTIEAVCELLRQIDGIDVGMLGQYGATVKKVGVSRRSKGEVERR